MSVDYAPDGPAFFAGVGAPVSVGISLQFSETSIWTRTDFDGVSTDIVQTAGSKLQDGASQALSSVTSAATTAQANMNQWIQGKLK